MQLRVVGSNSSVAFVSSALYKLYNTVDIAIAMLMNPSESTAAAATTTSMDRTSRTC